MDTRDDDIQASWWRTCDFICSAVDTIIFVTLFGAVVFGLCALSALIMMVVE